MADGVPTGELPLAGPSPAADASRLPLRGDLAHVKLAGLCFVPHYAAPMRMAICAAGATLRAGAGQAAAAITLVTPGTPFDVLDFAGGWAWGQVDEGLGGEGLVGYLPEAVLARP